MSNKRVLAVASDDDQGLRGEVSMHFGRCPYYTLVKVVNGKVASARTVANPHFQNHRPGMMPQYVSGMGADVVLAGGMGPKAIQLFGNLGIDVATGAVGQVGEVVDAYLNGRLSGVVPCQHDHPQSCHR
jgi:predicted Fe-Mo cluster-binding NifX family protein